jgi:hypothetical protein
VENNADVAVGRSIYKRIEREESYKTESLAVWQSEFYWKNLGPTRDQPAKTVL